MNLQARCEARMAEQQAGMEIGISVQQSESLASAAATCQTVLARAFSRNLIATAAVGEADITIVRIGTLASLR